MPFKECSIVSTREEFCRLALAPGGKMRVLCRRWGISPSTGYKWLARFEADGVLGLVDRSRRPLVSPGQTSGPIEERVLEVRRAHPAWGGRKIWHVLKNHGLATPPSISTITAILRRHGLLNGPGAGQARNWIRFERAEPNELWQMDFKGWFDLASGRCHPLTVLDDCSRYSLEIGACGDERGQTVQARLLSVFDRYGLPWRILADNGPPWGTAGHGKYSTLGVWLMDLGIGLGHGRPYHPQTQGKDERFHRTLKAEVLGQDFKTLADAQAAFDAWRPIYNTERPHEAIGMKTPSDIYTPSLRQLPQTIAPAEYETKANVRTVDANGLIVFKGRKFRGSKAFAGKRVILRATNQDGLFDLCYRRHRLAQIDLRQDNNKSVHHVSEQVSTLSPV
jgi:transposase InsO family protein